MALTAFDTFVCVPIHERRHVLLLTDWLSMITTDGKAARRGLHAAFAGKFKRWMLCEFIFRA
jgi:hypothetical protein